MFESVKRWFDSINEPHHLFNHPDDHRLHVALASLLYHMMVADGVVSKKEKAIFFDFMQQECDLNEAQTVHLFEQATQLKSSVHQDIETLAHYLKPNPVLRKQFMEKLNQLMDLDWVEEAELETFEEALHAFFPEIKDD